MAQTRCSDCGQEISNEATVCSTCSAPGRIWPLHSFTRYYLVGGLMLVMLCAAFSRTALAGYVATIWLLVGLALALIVYGRSRRRSSAGASLVYLLGIAWLILLLIVGLARIMD